VRRARLVQAAQQLQQHPCLHSLPPACSGRPALRNERRSGSSAGRSRPAQPAHPPPALAEPCAGRRATTASPITSILHERASRLQQHLQEGQALWREGPSTRLLGLHLLDLLLGMAARSGCSGQAFWTGYVRFLGNPGHSARGPRPRCPLFGPISPCLDAVSQNWSQDVRRCRVLPKRVRPAMGVQKCTNQCKTPRHDKTQLINTAPHNSTQLHTTQLQPTTHHTTIQHNTTQHARPRRRRGWD
jgi:hypothetical protein